MYLLKKLFKRACHVSMLGYHCLGSVYAMVLTCPHEACHGLGCVPHGCIAKALACPWDPSKAMATT